MAGPVELTPDDAEAEDTATAADGTTAEAEDSAPSRRHQRQLDRRAAMDQLSGIRIGLADVLCIGPILLYSIWGFVTLSLTPELIANHPVLLEALRGGISSIIVSSSQAARGLHPLWLVLIAPIVAMDFTDPFFYWAGRRYGRAIINWYIATNPGLRRPIARGERLFARYGAWTILMGYFLPGVASTFFYLAAGEVRMPLWLFFLADLTGTMIWIGVLAGLGWHLGNNAQAVADTISSYGFKASIALVILYVGWSSYRNWRAAKDG